MKLIAVVLVGVIALALVPAAVQAQGVMFVKNNRVGVGIDNPVAKLHVSSSDGTASVLVDEAGAAPAIRELFRLRNNGRPQFKFEDTDLGAEWQFAMKGAGFTIRKTGSGETELQIDSTGRVRIGVGDAAGTRFDLQDNGNLTILGTLTELNSSARDLKQAFSPVDSLDILNRVVQLPVTEWSYKHEGGSVRHLGPMADDFMNAFGLGVNDRTIAPRDEAAVALVAIQGLHQLVEVKNAEIDRLRQDKEDLASRLLSLEQAVAQLMASP